jgi:broad specificity phosphatase PhoE
MKLYVLRHCIAKSNENGIAASISEKYCGGLSKAGIEQAMGLVPKLKKYKFDAIIVSRLKRTIQTVRPYLDSLNNPPKIIISKLVLERDLGKLKGKTIEELDNYKKKNSTYPVSWKPSRGESVLDVYNRAKKFVVYLKKNFNKNSSILLVSHSVFLRCLDAFLTNKDIMKIYSYKGPKYGDIKEYLIK